MNKTVNIMGNVDVNKLKNQTKEVQNTSAESNTDNNTSTNENIGNFQVDLVGSMKINKSNKCDNNFSIDLVACLKEKESNNDIDNKPSGDFRMGIDLRQFLHIGVDKDKMKDELGV